MLNHGLFKSKDKTDGALNVRTIMFGGIAYILFHAFVNSTQMKDYFFKDYFWWLMLLDIFVMGIIYRLYYKRSMFNEIKQYDSDIYIEDKHIYIPENKNKINLQDKKDDNINNTKDANINNNKDTIPKASSEKTTNTDKEVTMKNIVLEESIKN